MTILQGIIIHSIQTIGKKIIESLGDYSSVTFSLCSFSAPETEIPNGWGYFFITANDQSTVSYNLCSFSVPPEQLPAELGYYFLSANDQSTVSYNLCSFSVPPEQLSIVYPEEPQPITGFRSSIYGVSSDAVSYLSIVGLTQPSFTFWEVLTSPSASYKIIPTFRNSLNCWLSGGENWYDASLQSLSARMVIGIDGKTYKTTQVALKPYESILDIPNLQLWLDASDSTTLSAGTGVTKNSFIDSSSNNFAITKSGNPGQGTFTPFPTNGAVYNPTVHGGSCYFDGSTSTLTTPNFTWSSGDFTIETWVNFNNINNVYGVYSPNNQYIFDTGSGNMTRLQIIGGGLQFYINGTLIISHTLDPVVGVWYHLAVSRQSNTIRMFVNGVSVGTPTTSSTTSSAGIIRIGNTLFSGGAYNAFLNGYLSSFRIVNGPALYTSNFTPSTSPLTNVANTSLLLNFTNGLALDGTGKNNLVLNGEATVVNSVKKYGIGSYYFDGSGDFILAPAEDDYNFGSGDFTIECWVRFTNTTTGNEGIIDTGSTLTTANPNQWFIYRNGNILRFGRHAVSDLLTYNTSSLSPYTWYHIAVTRDNGELSMFIDGVRVTSAVYSGWVIDGSNVRIGAIASPFYMNGWIDDVRLTKGIARYGPETVLLLNGNGTNNANNNTFLDSSSTPATITGTGSVTQGIFSPFPRNGATYNPAIHGGSGYFNGANGALITISDPTPFNFGTGDFTIECWINLLAVPNSTHGKAILDSRPNNTNGAYWILGISNTGGILGFSCGNTLQNHLESTRSIVSKKWYHVAITKSSNTLSMYIDGILEDVVTNTLSVGAGQLLIGCNAFRSFAPDTWFDGFISDVRILKGTARTITSKPSSPLTNITNTSLLLNFTNGGVIDSSGRNNLVTVGDAKISTAITKYGTGSIYFDGSSRVEMLVNESFTFRTDPFTFESWIYPTSVPIEAVIYGQAPFGNNYFLVTLTTDRKIRFWSNSVSAALFTSTTSIPLNNWTHVAVVREGAGTDQTKLYLNGVMNLSGTCSTDYINQTSSGYNPVLGGYKHDPNYNFRGYIDDLRITKGVAVYTSNFTPPTSQLTITNTTTLSVTPFTPPSEHPNSSSGDPYFNNVSMLAQANQPSDEVYWLDKSPMANVAFQTNGTYAPSVSANAIGTRSALVFDGTGHYLNLANPISPAANNASSFFVYGRPSSGTYSSSLGNLGSTSVTTATLQWQDNQIYGFQTYSYPKNNIGSTVLGVTKNPSALYMNGLARQTCLLTLQNNTLVDNSGRGAAFTTTGTLTVSSVSISGVNTSAWYFNGSSYTTTPNTGTFNFTTNNSTSSSNVTIECWMYLMGSGNRGIAGARGNGQGNGWGVYIDGNNFLRIASAFDGEGWTDNPITGAIPNNTWVHITIVKGNDGCTGYINGVTQTTLTKKTGFNYQASQPVIVGAVGSQGERPFNGYISNFRIVRGALYNTNFTVPSIPLATISTSYGAVDQPDYGSIWGTSNDVLNGVGVYGGYRHKGPIGEIVYANCTLPDPELELVGNSLRTKWGITQ